MATDGRFVCDVKGLRDDFVVISEIVAALDVSREQAVRLPVAGVWCNLNYARKQAANACYCEEVLE